MRRPLFLPSARQTNWLLIVGFLSVGEALYIRYMAIENTNVELACQAGLNTWLCSAFRVSIVLFNHDVFGGVALAAALLNLIRPSIVLMSLALAAAGFGIVLHNAELSALAAGLFDSQPGASRARERVTARARNPAQSQIACQLAKVSLNAI